MRLPMDSQGGVMESIKQADALLFDANLPTYTQAMEALIALAKAIGHAQVDQHQVFKAWVLIDRYSIRSKE